MCQMISTPETGKVQHTSVLQVKSPRGEWRRSSPSRLVYDSVAISVHSHCRDRTGEGLRLNDEFADELVLHNGSLRLGRLLQVIPAVY